ncbi:MAG: hypothetical protein KatS3mg114_0011 [Planctomycetaceae bacterium]|nr:MAG: hypothetical protein KatS3mg114_0011 [Planctomycetaceae bacterium]
MTVCTGIAVLNPQIPFEVQFDEHKLLIVYGEDLASFESVFDDYRVEPDDQLRFISEAEHIHSSSEHFGQRFEELKYRLGIES